jgi:hypothetical protein
MHTNVRKGTKKQHDLNIANCATGMLFSIRLVSQMLIYCFN